MYDKFMDALINLFNCSSFGTIVTIVLQCATIFFVYLGCVKTNKTTKEVNQENLNLQEKWNQKKLDASLIANARIEWIQKVRNTTAELIALCIRVINSTDKDEIAQYVFDAQEKTELLILFFGHEEKNDSKEKIDLYNKKENDNKNEGIVEFLIKLSNDLNTYYLNVKNNTQEELSKIRDERMKEFDSHILDYKEIESDSTSGFNTEPILDEDYQDELDQIKDKIKECADLSQNIRKELKKLQNIIRIYLKIEWNKSKKGE